LVYINFGYAQLHHNSNVESDNKLWEIVCARLSVEKADDINNDDGDDNDLTAVAKK